MNITGGNTLPTIGRHTNWQLVILASGLAIALSAGALFGAFDRQGTTVNPADTRPPSAQAFMPAPAIEDYAQAVYIVLDSEQQAAELRGALSTYGAAFPELAPSIANAHLVVIEDSQQEARLNAALATANAELMDYGGSILVMDLRTEPPPALALEAPPAPQARRIVYVVDSPAERQKLEQQPHEIGAHWVDGVDRTAVVLQTPDQYNILAGEAMATGAFEVIDLRN